MTFLIFGILTFVTGILIVALVLLPRTGTTGWNFIILLPIVGVIWYFYLRIPLEIATEDGNSFKFRSVITRTELSPYEIISIKGMFMSPGFIRLKHTGGTITLFTQMTGLHEFISTVKAVNPNVEISGC